jgi:excisionase family DNA binding protein
MSDDPFLLETDVAALLGIKRSTVEKWRHRNYGPPYVRVGRLVRYRSSAVAAWIEEQTVRPNEPTS